MAALKETVTRLAERINAPTSLLPTYGHSLDGAHPHVESDETGLWHYVTIERGQELDRKTTDQTDDLLYWIFSDVTFSMSVSYEAQHRIAGEDPRRQYFRYQENLLSRLNENWQQRKAAEHAEILKRHPFRDVDRKMI